MGEKSKKIYNFIFSVSFLRGMPDLWVAKRKKKKYIFRAGMTELPVFGQSSTG
jgi:hypothetical protein